MKYSYIKPRSKTALTTEMQLLFTFFAVALLMLLLTYIFLLFRDYRFDQNRIEISQQKQELRIRIENMKKQITKIEKQSMLSEIVFTKNSVLKDSINNMFDLVPSRITLSQAKIMKDGLILYGITPNKDIYNFMLQAPLRSIFNRSYSSFYPAQNGWYRFVSTNHIDEEEIKGEN
ncbi:hypothetical protein HUE87_10350 [Candidatus Sulfurimonas marisnigri]|uniref:Fimbrial assembly protein n=1 Tax=Candidatus Sulfurimonas marisnigri TaxID=2740405 RepID=A0A7S7RQ31_9BACT|nr:hypothetical protein [Candidatus Sulfurimonas marisnigri]QOY54266.1 hypothetical protein HUE87_10350 [Candidatus Sulfurimonas marisnigri]